MGFFDTRENLQELAATAGNVQAAVERLLGNPVCDRPGSLMQVLNFLKKALGDAFLVFVEYVLKYRGLNVVM
ncbi:hypothetical protein OSB04_000635 [Centaurea solstitialis]|uniref:UBA domain-containing protein n=1 Tax=Centaurea solstitialis TaxID=347529 RepID=A0AA38TR95_9ASTR|nr:hypothetical protein OSB04_000635 [Centaurea solstitialis]